MVPALSLQRMLCALPSVLCSAFLVSQALAQPAPSASRPDPLDPKATLPVLRYESATTSYRRLSDEKPVPWRDANDAVARIGGWRVYAREAQRADEPAPALPEPRPPAGMPADVMHKPLPAGHGSHRQP